MVQQVCMRKGINRPAGAIGSSDPQIIQMVAIANEEGQDLSARYPWEALQNESTFLTVATESQGVLATLASTTNPENFRYVMNNIMWNRDLRRPVFGPLTPQQWQQLKAQNITGPWNQYRVRGGEVLFIPAPAAGQTIAFEWLSRAWVDGVSTNTSSWQADADVGLLDEEIMTQGVLWRWEASKGLEYAEDYNKYERLVADAMARDGSKPVLNLNGGNVGYPAGTWVPIGSWPV